MKMLSLNWVATLVITFAVRQLAKFGEQTDWAKVRVDMDARIRDLIPGEFFDEFVVAFMNKVLDLIVEMMKDQNATKTLFTMIAEKKFNEAINYLMQWVRQHLSF